jgi:elongation factor G
VIPTSFIPAVEKGVHDAMAHGPVAGFPVKAVRVRLQDGSYHSVDSSEQAFRMAGSLAMRDAMAAASPALLEPIMLVTLSVPRARWATSSATSTAAAGARRAWSRSA